MHNLTIEQEACIQGAILGDGLKIKAFAGSGKTSTLVEIAKKLSGRGLYLAYNTATALEAQKKFPKHVDCKTAHSIAHKACRPLLSDRIPRSVKIYDVLTLGINDLHGCSKLDLAREVIRLINKFVQTDDPLTWLEPIDLTKKIYLRTEESEENEYKEDEVKEYIKKIAYEFWQKTTTLGSTLAISHDIYLKLYQLSNPNLSRMYDFILFDECQDANPVLLDIVTKQTCQKIYVGDEYQQIYSWRGAVNAFSRINGSEFYLTKSFRFGLNSEKIANMILSINGAPKKLIGNDKINTQVISDIEPFNIELPYTVLCRKNETVIETVLSNLDKKIHVVGSISSTLSLLNSGYALLMEDFKNVTYPILKQFKSWDSMIKYHAANEDKDRDITLLLNFIDKYKDNLIETLAKLNNATHVSKGEEADIIISTIHKSKGEEWNNVVVEDDFKLSEKTGWEEWNLLYVAVTRAEKKLYLKGNLLIDITNIHNTIN